MLLNSSSPRRGTGLPSGPVLLAPVYLVFGPEHEVTEDRQASKLGPAFRIRGSIEDILGTVDPCTLPAMGTVEDDDQIPERGPGHIGNNHPVADRHQSNGHPAIGVGPGDSIRSDGIDAVWEYRGPDMGIFHVGTEATGEPAGDLEEVLRRRLR